MGENMKIPKPQINSDILLGLAEEKIKKLEEFISMHNVAIKNHTAKKGEIISGLKYKVTDLQEMLLERDNYVKKLHNLRSEDVKVIDDLKENLSVTEEALELARDKIRSLNIIVDGVNKERDFINKNLTYIKNERENFINKYTDALNVNKSMQSDLNRLGELMDRDAKTIRKLMDDNQNKQIDGTSDKITRLESNLAVEKHNNSDLINHINTLQVYKAKYYKTVETLKVHLPN